MTANRTSLTIDQTIYAPVEKVFRAWTDPEQISRWFAPGAMHVAEAHADPTPGGAYAVHMRGPDGADHVTTGVYKAVVPNEKLVFSWQWQGSDLVTEVTVEFRAVNAGETRLTLTHRGFPDQDTAAKHQHGWAGCLASLAAAGF